MADKIQIRRDTAANWTSADPTLAQGEIAYETDTDKVKIGDGSTAWTSLGYVIDTGSYLTDITGENIGDLSDVTITSASSGQVLKYNGSAWVNSADTDTGITDVVQDTTPQLGGDLDANGHDIDMGTNTITDTKVGNWDTAYGWGNHASAGYLDSGDIGSTVQAYDATIVVDADIGVTVQAYDADTAKTDTTQNFTAPQRSADTVDNDGSFDLSAAQNFTCTPTGSITLTFTNIPDGQSGFILLVNTTPQTVSLHANTKGDANLATALSTAGTYLVSYYANGTNVYLTTSGAIA